MPEPSRPTSTGRLWLLLPCSTVAAGIALVPCASLLAQRAPVWLIIGAGLAVFPFLPLVWHLGAEARGGGAAFFGSRTRLALRILTLALLVLCVSLGDLGAPRVLQNLRDLIGRLPFQAAIRTTPAPHQPSLVPSQLLSQHGLEGFIPADATLVVGLSGSAAMRQLLSAHGVDTREKLAALATCKIEVESARVLIASRGNGTQMIVVRAHGIGDERNLYCLVGVIGSARLQIRVDGTAESRTFLVQGFHSRPLTFRSLDPMTVSATDESWQDTVDTRAFPDVSDVAQGRLAMPLGRVDRRATLWSASVADTPEGTWDLAFDAHMDGDMFKLHGSSVPPSGDGDRAEINARVPLTFVSSLPEGALAEGIRGVLAAVAATGNSLSTLLPTATATSAGRSPGGRASVQIVPEHREPNQGKRERESLGHPSGGAAETTSRAGPVRD